MFKGQNLLAILQDELVNPVVILNNDEQVIWCNKSMSQLINKETDWNTALKKGFKQIFSNQTNSKVLLSLRYPTRSYEVKTQLLGDKRYLELKSIILKERPETTQDAHASIDPIIENLAENFSKEFTSQEIHFDIFCHNMTSIIHEDKLLMGLSYFLKAVTQVSTKSILKLDCQRLSENNLNFSISIENLNSDKFELTKDAIKRKSILFLQRTEEVFTEHFATIDIKYQNQDKETKRIIFSLSLSDVRTNEKIQPPPHPATC